MLNPSPSLLQPALREPSTSPPASTHVCWQISFCGFALSGATLLPEGALPACPELPNTVHCYFQDGACLT